MKGTYTLLVSLAEPAEIEFGAKGPRALDSGWYAAAFLHASRGHCGHSGGGCQ
ncbi:hypothetical protein [Haladaptatus sp. W1]|uniref:hypothetical protein n=1 Tax=Haladaptatus sp. W1 TaxID=1897478 RepID=UPI001585D4DD|nr:hypothetical protein [Haladaptatus sp. W1]